MKSRRTPTHFAAIIGFAACFHMAVQLGSAQTVLVDSQGFEGYTNSTVVGQSAQINDGTGTLPWFGIGGGAGSAVVQTTTVAPGGGTQALQVTRAANSDDFWGVFNNGGFPTPPAQQIFIEWDMYVEQAPNTGQTYGPFFGIDAYDQSAGVKRLGALGVDAFTGEVLYIDASSFGLQPTSVVAPAVGTEIVNFNEWNNFRLVLDYPTETYFGYLNDALILETDFVTAGATQFTDADIAALAAFSGAADQAAGGTAYFDNYVVWQVPEPTSIVFLGLGVAAIAFRRRRR